MFFLGPKTMSPKLRGAQVALLQNSAGHSLRGAKVCGAQVEGSKPPRGKFAFNIFPAEFWTPQPLPRGFLDPSTCAPRSFGALQPVPRGILETYSLKLSKIFIFFLILRFFLLTSDILEIYDHLLRKKYFAGRNL